MENLTGLQTCRTGLITTSLILKVLQTAIFCVVYLNLAFDYEINAASIVEHMHVLTSLFCSDTSTLPHTSTAPLQ